MTRATLPSIAEIEAAAATLALIAAASNNPAGAQQEARQVMERARSQRSSAVSARVSPAFADAARADLAALFAAEMSTCAIGECFSVADADDTTDNALAAAKGSAVANKDLFQRTAAAAVKYLGAYDAAFTTADASVAD